MNLLSSMLFRTHVQTGTSLLWSNNVIALPSSLYKPKRDVNFESTGASTILCNEQLQRCLTV